METSVQSSSGHVAQVVCRQLQVPQAQPLRIRQLTRVHEAWVTLASSHSTQLQMQEAVGWQAAQGLGQGSGAQAIVGQSQCLQALGVLEGAAQGRLVVQGKGAA